MNKTKQQLAATFAAPGNEWRAKPFWSWNGELEADELIRQLQAIKDMGWGGHFMHSRSGLATEYLGEEWFDLINKVADASEKLGLESYLYDEDRWPSGSAGGKVTVEEQYRMKSLTVIETPVELYAPVAGDLAVYLGFLSPNGIDLWASEELAADTSAEEVAAKIAAQPLPEQAGSWKVLRFAIVPDEPNSNYNGTTYIDTMSEKATRRFIELTHEQYAEKCSNRIGTTIKGIFTDEPHRGVMLSDLKVEENGVRRCGMAWTDDLFEEFEKRYGYPVRPLLPRLFYRWQANEMDQCKLFYIDLADNLFLERFAVPLDNWCKEHGIDYTGHVLHEDSLTNQTVPEGSLMRFYEHQGVPGVDVLTESNRCYWVVKQLASTARQVGKPWMLSELYGCTGWQFDFRGHKIVGDWQALFGINLRCPHLSWYTMEGEAKRDYPASLLHQSTWYKDYPLVEDYFARFGVLMQGDAACDVLVLNPIESLWPRVYLGWAKWIVSTDPDVEKIEKAYTDLFGFLTGSHIDFDYGEEDMLSRLAAVETENGVPLLRVGCMKYRTVVVGGLLTMRPTTLSLLQQFAAAGGKIIFAGEVPGYINAVACEDAAKLAERCVRVDFTAEALTAAVRAAGGEYAEITDKDGRVLRDVFVQVRRHGENLWAAVLLNTCEDAPRAGYLQLALPAGVTAEGWDMKTGSHTAANGEYKNGVLTVPFALESAGTCAFVFTADKEALPAVEEKAAEKARFALPTGEYAYSLDEENICVLDFTRWRWVEGDDRHAASGWHPVAEALKADQQIRDDIGIEHRGGNMVQPWYSKLHFKQEYGTLEMEYEFEIETLPKTPVTLAAERPDKMSYAVNGVPLAPDGSIWVDICFKRMPIPAGVLKLGKNTVTVRTVFTRNTNLEALYLVGDFGVRAGLHTNTLTALPKTLHFGDLSDQGLPFFTGCLTYTLPAAAFAGAAEKQSADGKVLLAPGMFHGALVRVITPAGTQRVGWEPYTADITDAVKARADVQLVLVGTRRNTFGPLHLDPPIAFAYGPMHFTTEGTEWSEEYRFIPSGIESCDIVVE